MICSNCGQQISDTAEFCRFCGSKIIPPDYSSEPADQQEIPAPSGVPVAAHEPLLAPPELPERKKPSIPTIAYAIIGIILVAFAIMAITGVFSRSEKDTGSNSDMSGGITPAFICCNSGGTVSELSSLSLAVGDTLQVYLSDGNGNALSAGWASSNSAVFGADIYGNITAYSEGTAQLSATYTENDKDYVYYCSVVVRNTSSGEQVGNAEPSKSTYELYMADVDWYEARDNCESLGGHLATITTQEEFDEITALAESYGAKYIWLGGNVANTDGYLSVSWITGEDFSFAPWCLNQPSGFDDDGTTVEDCIILWYVEQYGGWSFNDVYYDPLSYLKYYKGNLAYVCEFEDGY